MEPPRAVADAVVGLHHLAIAVPSIDGARELWERALGLAAGEPELVPEQGVRVLVLRAGEQRIELLEPVGESSPIAGFLERRGGGLHHVAFLVTDLAAAIARLVGRGVRMIDAEPKPGSHGTRVAFVHPKATGGVLVELVEDKRATEESAKR